MLIFELINQVPCTHVQLNTNTYILCKSCFVSQLPVCELLEDTNKCLFTLDRDQQYTKLYKILFWQTNEFIRFTYRAWVRDSIQEQDNSHTSGKCYLSIDGDFPIAAWIKLPLLIIFHTFVTSQDLEITRIWAERQTARRDSVDKNTWTLRSESDDLHRPFF